VSSFWSNKSSSRQFFFESLILAQDERWRRALSMQVERKFVARWKSVADGWV